MANNKLMPTVFAVGNNYQIFVPIEYDAIITVSVGDEVFYDDSNGILRSNIMYHSVEIPMEKLDNTGEYTINCRKMIDRKPYFPVSEEPFCETFRFKPVRGEKINIYHIADAHNMEQEPIAAGQYFGDDLDLLILNGDIPNHSGDIANFNSIYKIAYGVTGGNIPVVFARGNHDTRGIFAEEFERYTPCENRKSYFTFRLGKLWGLVLDCGEDKLDSHEEYGNTVCFHNYRLKQTQFIKTIIKNSKNDGTSSMSRNIMHNKFYIFDDRILITGSANLSHTDMSGYNTNSVIIIDSTKVAKIYKKEQYDKFKRMKRLFDVKYE